MTLSCVLINARPTSLHSVVWTNGATEMVLLLLTFFRSISMQYYVGSGMCSQLSGGSSCMLTLHTSQHLAVSVLFWFEGLDGGGPYHSSSESNQYVYFHEYSLVDASPPQLLPPQPHKLLNYHLCHYASNLHSLCYYKTINQSNLIIQLEITCIYY